MKNRLFVLALVLLLLLSPFYYGVPLYGAETIKPAPAANHDSVTLGELGLFKTEMEYLGNYKITHYTNAADENGGWVDHMGNGITSTGNPVMAGFTAAALRGSLPYGTKVYIQGYGIYIVDDCGVGAKQIDVAVADKQTAEELGVRYADVWIVRDGG